MPLDVYESGGDQPHRWRVTNDAAVPEILATSSEAYTERRGAYQGAAHTLEQLLRHHPDARQIVTAWCDDNDLTITERPEPWDGDSEYENRADS